MTKRCNTRMPNEGHTEPPCLDCEGRGWLHMTSDLRGQEIQRCDECCFFEMDEEATKVHDEECGCSWAGSNEEPEACELP
jgi:hypothetical protein